MIEKKKLIAFEQNNIKLKKELKEAKIKIAYQEQIIFHQSKMAAMGEMIGIIAHQWKQPLNSVSILVQEIFFNLKINDSENIVDVTLKNEIEGQLDYMSQTIDDFKNFFKKDKIKTDINIVKLIDNILKLLAVQLRSNQIKVNIQLGLNGKFIEHDKEGFSIKNLFDTHYLVVSYINELKQVLLNILLNSKDALVSNLVSSQMRFINIIIDRQDSNSVVIIIEDNAGGIKNEKELSKIWQPYFTTKNEGTGIGLYISKTIVEKNLFSTVESKNGEFGLQTKLIIQNI